MHAVHMFRHNLNVILAARSIPTACISDLCGTLYMFVQPSAQCLPLSKLLGFLWAVSKSDSISHRSHMATLQLSAPVKPFAMWERSALFMDTHMHMHLHTYLCIQLIHFAGAYRPPTAWFILPSKSENSGCCKIISAFPASQSESFYYFFRGHQQFKLSE